jgi:threonine synthase
VAERILDDACRLLPPLDGERRTVVSQSFVNGLQCCVCGKTYPVEPINFCTDDFGPLEVVYDYAGISDALSRKGLSERAPGMWRYREFLPLDKPATVGRQTGGTPLVKADRLAAELGVETVYVKNDAVNYPTLSFKDRVTAVALSKAKEFGFTTVGCASTGNLANSVAANAAACGLEAYIFVPADLERAKILNTSVYGAKVVAVHGTYDEVNRLCTQVAFKYGWGFVNINLRPFYAEGSKTVGYEIAEQLGWRVPRNVVVPMAGGSLIGKVHKAFGELEKVGLVEQSPCRVFGAQATGCNPISNAVKESRENHRPIRRPNTIAKSLAIGDPADGYFAAKLIRDTHGWAEDVSDAEIVDGIRLLAETEGIFAETAGGVTVAVAKKLIEQGRIPRDEEVVLCITGNGLKTQDAIADAVEEPAAIRPSLDAFVDLLDQYRVEVEEGVLI